MDITEDDIDKLIKNVLSYISKDMNIYGKLFKIKGLGICRNTEGVIKYINDLNTRDKNKLLKTALGWYLVSIKATDDYKYILLNMKDKNDAKKLQKELEFNMLDIIFHETKPYLQ